MTESHRGPRLGWVLFIGAALLGACALAMCSGGCYVVPKADDAFTDFDESSEETVIVGLPAYDQPVGTGAPFSEPVDGDPWWWTALQIAGTVAGGNLAIGLASVLRPGSRGGSNLKNLFRMKSTWKSTARSAVAMALPTASPPEAQAIAVADIKAAASAAVAPANGGK